MISIKLDEKAINAVMSVMGDEQKLELQKAVVAAFAKHYLKDLVADPAIQSAVATITNDINEHIMNHATAAKDYWASEDHIGEPLKNLVSDHVIQVMRGDHYTVATQILEQYEEKIQKSFDRLFADIIRTKLNEQLKSIIINDTYIDKLVKDRAIELLTEKLENK